MGRIRRVVFWVFLLLLGCLFGLMLNISVTRPPLPLEGGGVLSPGEVAALGEILCKGNGDVDKACRELVTYFDYDSRAIQLSLLVSMAEHVDDPDHSYNSPLQRSLKLIPKFRDQNYALFDDVMGFCLFRIDYRIAGDTVPEGMDFPFRSFYPCADTLVRLNVRRDRIFWAMGRLVNVKEPLDLSTVDARVLLEWVGYSNKLRLLTWVLYQIEQEDVDVVHFLLHREGERSKEGKENFFRAIKLLENPQDLLPPIVRTRVR